MLRCFSRVRDGWLLEIMFGERTLEGFEAEVFDLLLSGALLLG